MLLALDTSTSQTGLCLYDGAKIIAESLWVSRAHHTQELAPALKDILRKSATSINDVQAIGVALGPGSFTSLRVGLSFAKGLLLAKQIPLAGIGSLDITASSQPLSELPLIALLQAGRNKLAAQTFHAGADGWISNEAARVTNVTALANEITSPCLVCGELNAEERNTLAQNKNIFLAAPENSSRRPSVLAALAWRKWKINALENASALAPIYLRTEA